MTDKIGGFRPELGLEYVERYEKRRAELPHQAPVELTGGQVRHRVKELFPDSGLERKARAFVSPRPSDPSVLAPTRFESLVREAAEALRRDLAPSNNPARRALGDLLDGELALRDLLHHYRNALLGV
ncbi:MAG: hypothetical protein H6953_12475 [Chromatiaceae bacterium]|nr:hypothetical protein [Chromatiaceae bacterium]MCP5315835.1 hypothetical protein [Chromatiaceae bacterium]